MLLNVEERIVLLGILPKEGDFTTLKIIRDLQAELSFSEEENASLGLRREGEMVYWDKAEDKGKEIALGGVARKVVVDRLVDLEAKKKLPMDYFGVYERFVLGNE